MLDRTNFGWFVRLVRIEGELDGQLFDVEAEATSEGVHTHIGTLSILELAHFGVIIKDIILLLTLRVRHIFDFLEVISKPCFRIATKLIGIL